MVHTGAKKKKRFFTLPSRMPLSFKKASSFWQIKLYRSPQSGIHSISIRIMDWFVSFMTRPLEKARLVVVKGPMRIFFRHTKEVTGALEMAQLEVIIFKLHLESCFCWKTFSFITSGLFQLSNKSTQPIFMVRTETNFVWWRQANIIC